MPDYYQRTTKKKSFKTFIAIAGAFVIFSIGYGIGSGNLMLGRSTSKNSNVAKSLDFTSIQHVYDLLRKNFDGELSADELTEGMKHGLVSAAGDPYTQYFTAEETKEFNEELNGSFSGIGAELTLDKNKMVMVETPMAGYPAEKAGLKARDIIIKINDESAIDLSIAEAVKKIRGEAGTKVKLQVVRDNKEQLDFEIIRATISIPSVKKEIKDNIGYLQVLRFDRTTATLASQYAQELKQAKVNGIVLDLRNNPGGELDAAVDLASLWLPRDKVVLREKRGNTVIKTYKAKGGNLLNGTKTIVLINGGSASASEIVAGALKDNGAATLLGTKSYGKGSVQMVEQLSSGSSLKVTVARWYTPNDRNIDKEGIEPDQKVELSDDRDSDNQLQAALQALR